MLETLSPTLWNETTAAHLLNRAGWGGPPSEIQRLAESRMEAAVDRFVDFETSEKEWPEADWSRFDPTHVGLAARLRQASPEERQQLIRQRRRLAVRQTLQMQQWWLDRMVHSPRPLEERLTLFWHGHFATSLQKVKEPYLLWRQQQVFRRHGCGDWLTLLREVTRDPAMLVWLDQAQSRARHPNENYARELLELFTLGEGHYSEQDVTAAARALTGLTLDPNHWEPVERMEWHDSGEKTFLEKTGAWTGDDILQQISSLPQSARFITAKLWLYFSGVQPSLELNQALAEEFTRNGCQFRPFLRAMFRSKAFYAPAVVRQQIKGPVQWLVMACRQMERPLPPAPLSSNSLRLLGQELFLPPNVKGWEGGTAWINTQTLLTRHNLALLLTEGKNVLPMAANRPEAQRLLEHVAAEVITEPAPIEKLLPTSDRQSPTTWIGAFERRFFHQPLTARSRQTLLDYAQNAGTITDAAARNLVRLALCTPEYQLT